MSNLANIIHKLLKIFHFDTFYQPNSIDGAVGWSEVCDCGIS